ncbi:MAG: histidine ammonia-lyase [Chloroflexota bacterium]
MEPLLVNGENLEFDDVVDVALGRPVLLDPAARPRMERSREAVDRMVSEERVVYGITTGFGRFKDRVISLDEVRQLQLNLVRSHAVGVGPNLPRSVVRAMMVVRANTLSLGFSGVRPSVVQLLLDLLNAGITPRIPAQGSLGASGDLAPLAHLALVLIGEGEATTESGTEPGIYTESSQVLAAAGLNPLILEAKEGLALLNGTAQMVGMGALLVRRAINLILTADVTACLSLEALHGTDRAYDQRVHALRPHPRQIDCAAFLRRLLVGSQFLRRDDPQHVQDPYTLRCVPQVHGAVRDSIAYAQWVINIELNTVNDNPIIFVDDAGTIDVVSAGNFHGEPIALAMDYAALGLTELGNMSERRCARLVDADSNGGVLPMFLTARGGLESGLMMAQYTAAALASENKVLAHPASADTIPSSANVEDHVSMGATAVRQAMQILEHVETIVGIELLLAAQGINFRCREMNIDSGALGEGTGVAYGLVREQIPFLETDLSPYVYIESARRLVAEGIIKQAVEKHLGLP